MLTYTIEQYYKENCPVPFLQIEHILNRTSLEACDGLKKNERQLNYH